MRKRTKIIHVEREYPDDAEFTAHILKSFFATVLIGPICIALIGFMVANKEAIDHFFMKVATWLLGV